jgi:hypothetical protein
MNGVLRMMRDEAARVRARPDLSDAERERLLRDKYSAVITPVDQVRFRVRPVCQTRSSAMHAAPQRITWPGAPRHQALRKARRALQQGSDAPHDRAMETQFGPALDAAMAAFRSPRDIFQVFSVSLSLSLQECKVVEHLVFL